MEEYQIARAGNRTVHKLEFCVFEMCNNVDSGMAYATLRFRGTLGQMILKFMLIFPVLHERSML